MQVRCKARFEPIPAPIPGRISSRFGYIVAMIFAAFRPATLRSPSSLGGGGQGEVGVRSFRVPEPTLRDRTARPRPEARRGGLIRSPCRKALPRQVLDDPVA